MASSDVWDEKTARQYDEDASDKFAPEVLGPTVEFLTRLAGSGPALEFAIGTGRVAVPLAERGVPVTGIDLSEPMVACLRRKVDQATLPVFIGDMVSTQVPGEFALVYVVWNSISNLLTQHQQVGCFRNAARHLAPGGRFVVELWVPPIRRLVPGQSAVPMDVGSDHLVFDSYDLAEQTCTSHHYRTDVNGAVRYSSGNFRYIWPAECDLMAELAGMELEDRFADWDRSPFTSESESHVSVWRKPGPASAP